MAGNNNDEILQNGQQFDDDEDVMFIEVNDNVEIVNIQQPQPVVPVNLGGVTRRTSGTTVNNNPNPGSTGGSKRNANGTSSSVSSVGSNNAGNRGSPVPSGSGSGTSGRGFSLYQPFKKTDDLVVDTRYHANCIRRVSTQFGNRIRVYCEGFNYDLPVRFTSQYEDYQWNRVDYSNVYMHYVGREGDAYRTIIIRLIGLPEDGENEQQQQEESAARTERRPERVSSSTNTNSLPVNLTSSSSSSSSSNGGVATSTSGGTAENPTAFYERKVLADANACRHITTARREGSGRMCFVCLENEAVMILLPCGHFGLCSACSGRVESCPVCRSSITKKTRVFYTSY